MSTPSTTPLAGVAPDLREGLAALAEALPTDLRDRSDIEAYRRAGAARTTTAAEVADRLGLATEERASTRGSAITVFRPRGRAPRLRVLFLHGGGLIAGNRFDGVDVVARHAEAIGAEVASLEYPLAPEHGLDAMVDDVLDTAALLAADGLPLVLAGQSAGGGLAALGALEARGCGPRLAGQLLACPMLERTERPSTRQYAASPAWSLRSHDTAWAAALQGQRLLPPGERDDLDGLPPAFLDTGSAELFRDGILDYAARLGAHGNAVELHQWSGAFHGSDCVVEGAEVSRQAHRARGSWLGRLAEGKL